MTRSSASMEVEDEIPWKDIDSHCPQKNARCARLPVELSCCTSGCSQSSQSQSFILALDFSGAYSSSFLKTQVNVHCRPLDPSPRFLVPFILSPPRKQLVAMSILSTSSPSTSIPSNLVSALSSFYTFLTSMPYIPISSLLLPPPSGWPDIPTHQLRSQGKTEAVISLLAHIPYLSPLKGQAGSKRRWMMGPDTVGIPYCDGEMWAGWIDAVQPVPGWCVWLGEGEGRDSVWLMLDTKAGTSMN